MSGDRTTSSSADLEEVLDHLTALVEDARALPMSSSCVVHRGEVLDLVDEARRVLPAADTTRHLDDVKVSEVQVRDLVGNVLQVSCGP